MGFLTSAMIFVMGAREMLNLVVKIFASFSYLTNGDAFLPSALQLVMHKDFFHPDFAVKGLVS